MQQVCDNRSKARCSRLDLKYRLLHTFVRGSALGEAGLDPAASASYPAITSPEAHPRNPQATGGEHPGDARSALRQARKGTHDTHSQLGLIYTSQFNYSFTCTPLWNIQNPLREAPGPQEIGAWNHSHRRPKQTKILVKSQNIWLI